MASAKSAISTIATAAVISAQSVKKEFAVTSLTAKIADT